MIAADIMTADARTIGPNATIAEAVALMQRLEVRHLPVVDEDGELVGLVSDRDLRVLVALPSPDSYLETAETVSEERPSSATAVAEIMGGDAATIEPETNVDEVIDRLLESRAGALPVVGDDGKLAGIVSYIDVLRCWQQLRENAAGKGEGEARGNGGSGALGNGRAEEEGGVGEEEEEGEEVEEGQETRGQAGKQRARPAAKRPAAKKAAAQRPAASKSAAKRPAAARKSTAKKSTAKKPGAKKR